MSSLATSFVATLIGRRMSFDASRIGLISTSFRRSSPNHTRGRSSGRSGFIATHAPFSAPTLVPTTSRGWNLISNATWM